MPALFAALSAPYPTAASTAAALGMSRQAFSQAQARRRLSERATLRAAALLGIDPAAALLSNATEQDTPAPVLKTTPDPAPQIQDEKKPLKSKAQSGNSVHGTNYVRQCTQKKGATIGPMQKIVHVITQSKKRIYEIDCVKWMLCVPRLSPDSPRFAHYFSRWLIPEKIAASKKRGDFEEITKNCPLFSPELARYIQASIDEYHRFSKTTPNPPALKASPLQIVKVSAIAA